MPLPFIRTRNIKTGPTKYHLIASPDSADSRDTEVNLIPFPERKRSSPHLILCLHIIPWVLLLALGAYILKYSVTRDTGPQPIICRCGSSIAEAQRLGCKYDNLSVSWLPAHCRDDELTAEFERAGPGPKGSWAYWADSNATRTITVKEIALLADLPREQAVFFSSFGWHVAHCAFVWRKQFRMRGKGLTIESRYDQENRIEHCYSMFMSRDLLDEVSTRSVVKLGGDGGGTEHVGRTIGK
jgi:hypothetical protein